MENKKSCLFYGSKIIKYKKDIGIFLEFLLRDYIESGIQDFYFYRLGEFVDVASRIVKKMAKTNKSIHYAYILDDVKAKEYYDECLIDNNGLMYEEVIDEINYGIIDKMDIVIFYIYGDENEDEAKAFYYAREKKKQILEVCISMYRSGLLDI